MLKKVMKFVAGVLLVGAIAVPSNMAYKQLNINKELASSYALQLQEHKEEADRLTSEIERLSIQLLNNEQKLSQLEAENQSLEGVRLSLINNVGYIPNEYERTLLEQLVEAEAGGEDMQGKIAVANVVLNRLKSEKFPDSITAVIYQENQFEPISSGALYGKNPSSNSKDAVRRAFLGERVVDSNILYFWANWLDDNNSIWNHAEAVNVIGNHYFGK